MDQANMGQLERLGRIQLCSGESAFELFRWRGVTAFAHTSR